MNLKKILLFAIVLIVVVSGVIGWFAYRYIFMPNTNFNQESIHIYIKTDANFDDVLSQLKDSLNDAATFEFLAEKRKYASNVKPGHFVIEKGMSNLDIIRTLRSRNIPIQIRFNNQERIEDLAGHIATQIEADSVSLVFVMQNEAFLSKYELTPETALTLFIPNTYELYWNTSASAFVERMATEYDRFWNETRKQKAASINLTKTEVYNLASIVQKETAAIDERPRVAGVYLNRLKRGMLLQADPTVIFAVKKESNDFDKIIKRVLYKDLETDSPYNTYKYAGIPPGPIAMPDISSIDAVLNAEKHDYLYFVADTERLGYHKFSKTLAQHNVYRAQYIRWINAQRINR